MMSAAAPTDAELAALREALHASDAETQKLLAPLLPLRGVRDLLLSFVRDQSRGFVEWVWDPQVRQILERMRDSEPVAHQQVSDVDRWYDRAASERMDALRLASNRAEEEEERAKELLRAVESARNDGKDKFKRGNYYAARNAFMKALAALSKHQEAEYYGKTVEVEVWEQDAQDTYVTLCNNVAVCGIKEKDASVVREYAGKALAVDKSSSKALYAMTKAHLMEHSYHEAFRVLARAEETDPTNTQWGKLCREIEAAEAEHTRTQAELAEIKRRKDEEIEARNDPEVVRQAEEKEKAWREQQLQTAMKVPLPERDDDGFAAMRLNTYFMRTKQKLLVEIKPLHNMDKGESPLFACTVANGSTGQMLAVDVHGSSKKSVKSEACRLAIEKLWDFKQEAGTLVAADLEYLEKRKAAEAGEQPAAPSSPPENENASPSGQEYPVRLTITQRQLDAVQLLHQLNQQGKLRVRFDVEDVSPNHDEPAFKCTAFLNGEQVSVAQAPAKKKARASAAKQAMAAAFEKNLVMVWDQSELQDEEEE